MQARVITIDFHRYKAVSRTWVPMGSISSSEDRHVLLSRLAHRPELFSHPEYSHYASDPEFMSEIRELNFNADYYYYYAQPNLRVELGDTSDDDEPERHYLTDPGSAPSTNYHYSTDQLKRTDMPLRGCSISDSVCPICFELIDGDCVECVTCKAAHHKYCVDLTLKTNPCWRCPTCRTEELPNLTSSSSSTCTLERVNA